MDTRYQLSCYLQKKLYLGGISSFGGPKIVAYATLVDSYCNELCTKRKKGLLYMFPDATGITVCPVKKMKLKASKDSWGLVTVKYFDSSAGGEVLLSLFLGRAYLKDEKLTLVNIRSLPED